MNREEIDAAIEIAERIPHKDGCDCGTCNLLAAAKQLRARLDAVREACGHYIPGHLSGCPCDPGCDCGFTALALLLLDGEGE